MSMEIVVCVKQVPASTRVKLNATTNTIIREGIEMMLNPFDAYALEEALRVKAGAGGRVTVISMGIPSAAELLRYALALGADRAVLLSDKRFAGADTLATAYSLAAAVRKLGACDLILCGRQAVDGDTAQVGPSLAQKLGIPHLTAVSRLELSSQRRVLCEKMTDEGYQEIELGLPALLTVVKEINTPRFPNLEDYLRTLDAAVEIWSADDLEVDHARIGYDGSATWVMSTTATERRKNGKEILGPPQEAAELILGTLRQMGWQPASEGRRE
ncbi:MAG TPA: electron transfer flavoprotein subunit beta/FixA family protein [Anaerolineaceae bacterium]|jgi:electron transfer flavoprotein beta subunit|nr:electron transfer flavoprotein subunit beta/FixA family protein [Anaerolineaceae bacterium]HOT25301.1 electron transfer flavoprotein subunit beta/FixA family protein [Anaerolineaceae bacterium]